MSIYLADLLFIIYYCISFCTDMLLAMLLALSLDLRGICLLAAIWFLVTLQSNQILMNLPKNWR